MSRNPNLLHFLREQNQHVFNPAFTLKAMNSPPKSAAKQRQRKKSLGKERKTDKKSETKPNDYEKRVHHEEASLFSSTSGFDNYRGILNLCIVLLILSNFRVALDNILKYGVLIDPVQAATIFLEDPYRWPSACLIVCSNIFIQYTYFVENLLHKERIQEGFGFVLHVINLLTILFTPVTVVLVYYPPPWAAGITLLWYSMLWLKLISYISVNKWYRLGLVKEGPKGPVKYPDNLTQSDLYYFMAAPTLCYEINFPRLKRIRKRFLIRRVFELFFLLGIMVAVIQQEMDVFRAAERIMKLAIPNHFLWLLFFYASFHTFFNITGELLMFADRTFYRDWWNSSTVEYFWQNWNIPAHRWASSVPLRMARLWSFMAMLGQIPMAIFIRTFISNPNYGNIVVWCSIILGQPLAIMMYFHDFYVRSLQVQK